MPGLIGQCCDCVDADDYCCTDEPTGCNDTFCGYAKIATVTLSGYVSGATADFGTHSTGLYYGVYCGGTYSPGKTTLGGGTQMCCGSAANLFNEGDPLWGLVQGIDPKLVWAYSDACSGLDCSDVPDECTGPTTGCTGVVNDLGSRIHLRGSRRCRLCRNLQFI